MQIRYYLKRPNASNETAIFARISYNGQRLKYYLPETVNPKFWNFDTQQIRETKKFLEHPEFNERLRTFKNKINNAIRTYTNENDTYPSPKNLKSLLDVSIKKLADKNNPTFFEYFKDFIERSRNGTRLQPKTKKAINKNTVRTYEITYNFLMRMQQETEFKINFDTIGIEFYEELLEYGNSLNLTANYIGKHIKTIKTVMQEATDNGKNKNLDFQKRSFVTIQEKADNISLSEDELAKIMKLDLAGNTTQSRVRDLFIVGCYTGLRFSDIGKITQENIEKNILTVIQTKTGRAVSIPLHNNVLTILKKYDWNLPAPISNQKTNKALKDIMQLIPDFKTKVSISQTRGGETIVEKVEKWKLITTHTARRSFATNRYKEGLPIITIMAVTGHTTEKSFLTYIKITPQEHARIMALHFTNIEKHINNEKEPSIV